MPKNTNDVQPNNIISLIESKLHKDEIVKGRREISDSSVTLTLTLPLEKIRNERLKFYLDDFYSLPVYRHQAAAVLLNSIFAEGKKVFVMTKAILEELVKNDPNLKRETVDTKFWDGVNALVAQGFLKKHEQGKWGSHGGLYELVNPLFAEMLIEQEGEERLRIQEERTRAAFDGKAIKKPKKSHDDDSVSAIDTDAGGEREPLRNSSSSSFSTQEGANFQFADAYCNLLHSVSTNLQKEDSRSRFETHLAVQDFVSKWNHEVSKVSLLRDLDGLLLERYSDYDRKTNPRVQDWFEKARLSYANAYEEGLRASARQERPPQTPPISESHSINQWQHLTDCLKLALKSKTPDASSKKILASQLSGLSLCYRDPVALTLLIEEVIEASTLPLNAKSELKTLLLTELEIRLRHLARISGGAK